MKAMKSGAKAMSKGAIVKALAEQHEMKTKSVSGLLESLATLATTEVKKNGIFTIPGLARIKTRVKPATKAGVRMAFGQEIKVKAKPARTVVKAFPVAALRSEWQFSLFCCVTAPETYARGNPMEGLDGTLS